MFFLHIRLSACWATFDASLNPTRPTTSCHVGVRENLYGKPMVPSSKCTTLNWPIAMKSLILTLNLPFTMSTYVYLNYHYEHLWIIFQYIMHIHSRWLPLLTPDKLNDTDNNSTARHVSGGIRSPQDGTFPLGKQLEDWKPMVGWETIGPHYLVSPDCLVGNTMVGKLQSSRNQWLGRRKRMNRQNRPRPDFLEFRR